MTAHVTSTLPAEIVSNVNQSLRGNRWEITRSARSCSYYTYYYTYSCDRA